MNGQMDLFADLATEPAPIDLDHVRERIDHYAGCLSAVQKSSLKSPLLEAYFAQELEAWKAKLNL